MVLPGEGIGEMDFVKRWIDSRLMQSFLLPGEDMGERHFDTRLPDSMEWVAMWAACFKDLVVREVANDILVWLAWLFVEELLHAKDYVN